MLDEDIGEAIVSYIISARLCDAECANECGAGCVCVWTAGAYAQIGQHVKELVGNDPVLPKPPDPPTIPA